MSKLYKEQGALGASKLLASVALGQTQSSILATAKFENEILDISTLFSSKQSLAEQKQKLTAQPSGANTVNEEEKKIQDRVGKKEAGREEKPDDQKSEKTLRNREAMN